LESQKYIISPVVIREIKEEFIEKEKEREEKVLSSRLD
jgi:hypothetical protein